MLGILHPLIRPTVLSTPVLVTLAGLFLKKKKSVMGAGEMDRWFRAPGALVEDPDLVPSTHTVVHNHL